MTDRGKLEYFIDMQISQNEDWLTLDQETYVKTVIEKFSMQDSNPSRNPAQNNFKQAKAFEDEQLVDAILYRSLVSFLLYIVKQTRPDIVSIVIVLFRFMEKPTNSH